MRADTRGLLVAAVMVAAATCVGAAPADKGAHVVMISGFGFKPAELTVHAGDSVTWRNADIVAHTATAQGRFDSGAIAPNAAWTHRFTSKGRYDYVCSYHPTMKATIVVQ